jgi:hypothetical protein
MLDFYAIDDHESWNTPDEQRLVGALSLSEHNALSELFAGLGWGPDQPSHFDDQRFTAAKVRLGLERLRANTSEPEVELKVAIEKVLSIFEAAVGQGRGIQTYCD